MLATLSSMYGIPSVDTAVCPMPTKSKLKKKIPKITFRICECASCSSNVFSSQTVIEKECFYALKCYDWIKTVAKVASMVMTKVFYEIQS